MERPFDYPGSQSDMDAADPSHLSEICRATEHHGEMGEYYTHRMVCQVPTFWSDEEVTDVVREKFPSEHCTHSYDCCANYYAKTASWVDLREERDGYRLILVSYGFAQNI